MPNKFILDLSTMNEKQKEFFTARKKFVGYGGARGGGKSWAVQRKAILLALRFPGIKILLLRRTYKDLERNHARELERLLQGFAKYHKQEKFFTFPNGSMIELGYCAADSDALQYQGVEYDVIFFDEATQFTESQFSFIYPSVRGANGFPKRIYITCNPGGVGHEWVKRLFITRTYREGENPADYEFIPATVFDNRALLSSNPEYVKMLDALPDGLRDAWRDGNWDMLAGRYFSEFDRAIHAVDPFPIPDHWQKYRAIDYGLDCLACIWVAVDEAGNHYLYREYARPDKIISVGAREIIEETKGESIRATFAPPDLLGRSQESARTKVDLFRAAGLPLKLTGNDREAGWLAVHELLHPCVSEGGRKEARLKIFRTCPKILDCLPALQRDPEKPEDCLTNPHEVTHLPDALRYFATGFLGHTKPVKEEDPMVEYKAQRISQMRNIK